MNQRPDRPRNISFNIFIPESIQHEGVGDVIGQVIQQNVRYNLNTRPKIGAIPAEETTK